MRVAFTVERLRELLAYEAETGILRWKRTIGARAKAGAEAGSLSRQGYLVIGIARSRNLFVHRIGWAIAYGEWPAMEVDHINGDRADNRLTNLRLVSTAENHQNMRRARRDSKTGLLGVSPYAGKFRAQIQVAGKKRWLGEFDTAEAASAAYVIAKRQIHPKGTL